MFQPRFSRSASPPASQAALSRTQSSETQAPYPASLLALEEHLASTDPVLAHIFTTMRGTLGWSRERVAAGLQTSVATIDALEAGRVTGLPPWSETLRIVEAYGRLVGIDAGVILDRLQSQSAMPLQPLPQSGRIALQGGSAPVGAPAKAPPTASVAAKPALQDALARARTAVRPARPDTGPPAPARAVRSAPPPSSHAPPPVPKSPRPAAQREPLSTPATNDPIAKIAARLNSASAAQEETVRRSHRWRSRVAASIVAVVLGVGALLTARPASTNSEPVITLDRIAATFREGLRWVDVADPRSRKTDKLGAAQK